MAANVLVRCVTGPKAVALVLGPLGASPRGTLDGFGKMYQERHCTIVAATSPVTRFFFTQHRMLKPTAVAVLQETVQALQETAPETPLVVHLFSNGGAFLLEEIELVMNEVKNDTSPPSTPEESAILSWEDVELIRQRMEYQFYDSCPCYLHMLWDLSPYFQDAFPLPAWNPLFRKLYFLGSAFSLTLWCTVTGSGARSRQFWDRMQPPRSYCPHQIYVYTTADRLTDATRIDELIATRRRQPLEPHPDTITVRRYDDAGHCTLYRDHPEDYHEVLDEALAAAVNRRRPSSTEE